MIRSLFTVAQLRWRVWRAMFSSSLWQESILQIMLMFTPVFYKVPVSSTSCDIRVKIKHVIVLRLRSRGVHFYPSICFMATLMCKMFSCFNLFFCDWIWLSFHQAKLFEVIESHRRPHQTSTIRWDTKMRVKTRTKDTSQSITWQQLGAFKHIEEVKWLARVLSMKGVSVTLNVAWLLL